MNFPDAAVPEDRFWRRGGAAARRLARSDLWQLVEFSKRFTTDEVWPSDILNAHPEYRGKTLFDVLYRNGNVDRFPLSDMDQAYENYESKQFGFYLQKGLFEEYASFGRGHGQSSHHSIRITPCAACAGRSSTARRRVGATARDSIRM